MLLSVSSVSQVASCGWCAFSSSCSRWTVPSVLETRGRSDGRFSFLPTRDRSSFTLCAQPTADIVLSSGHMAFAAHCGFLEGVERSFLKDHVGAVVGTSSGALVGELTPKSEWLVLRLTPPGS